MLISFDKSSIQAYCAHDVLIAISLDKLTLDLAEALAASELFRKVHLIRCVIHHLRRSHNLIRFRHRPRSTYHSVAGFPVHTFRLFYQSLPLFVMAPQ
jgi:hypothetical protein